MSSSGEDQLVVYEPRSIEPYRDEDLDDSPQQGIRAGMTIVILFFVVLVGWAAFARLDSSAVGDGFVTVVGNRQAVQHRDGGTVRAVNVRDGQRVVAGQVLIDLNGEEVRAQERAMAASVLSLQAQRARLEAEVTGAPIVWPESLTRPAPEDRELASAAIALQSRQHAVRSQTLAAAAGVTRNQAAAIREQTTGISAQSLAAIKQRESLQDQLDRSRELAEKGFISMNNIRALERQIAALSGSSAEYQSRAASAREQIGQVQSELIQTRRRANEESAAALRDAQFQLNDTLPKWHAAREQLSRLEVRAPVAGRVMGLSVFGTGAVISPGQTIMDIVPEKTPLTIKVNFSPTDIDGVVEGAQAEVHFQSLHERNLPTITGVVRNVSADILKDAQTGRPYFTAEIVVPDTEIAELARARNGDAGVRAGVPVQVHVLLKKRTALQYMLEPLTEAFSHSLHER